MYYPYFRVSKAYSTFTPLANLLIIKASWDSPQQLQIGHINVPDWLIEFSGPTVINRNSHNEGTRPFLSALNEMVIDKGAIRVAYSKLKLLAGFIRDAMVVIGATKDMAPATLASIDALLNIANHNRRLTFG